MIYTVTSADGTTQVYTVIVSPATQNQTLTVTKNGTGTGTVTSNPDGINCGTFCTFSFVQDSTVTLTAQADSGSTFTGWSLDSCPDTLNTCTATTNQAQTVTATFDASSRGGTNQILHWIDGAIQYSMVTNCWSIASGTPYLEYGVGTYTGILANPEAGQPAINHLYYLHVVIYGLGNPCPQNLVVIDLNLPASTGLAIDIVNKLHCYYQDLNGNVNDYTNDVSCPQALSASNYNMGALILPSSDPQYGPAWPLAQGTAYEFQIPVISAH